MTSFFDTLIRNNFLPHGHCYFWRPDILWLNVISDGLIALSYYAIPIILVYFMLKRKDFPFPSVLAMFGAFILLCGTTHVMGIITVWDPLYSLDGIIKAGTAAISVLTTILLVPLVPLGLALKSPKELEAANQKLAEANEKLTEIDRLKDNFFNNISHELRTPLTLILAPLESFLSNDYGAISDTQRKNLEVMHNNSIRLFQMVNSILDFAKISAKKIEVKREPVDIILLTQSIVSEFKPMLEQKNIKINVTCDATKKIVNLDRYLYERILFNLLSNAAKFTPNNGIVSISLTSDQDKTILSVSDSGIGISEDEQKKLFQRFQQVEGSATRRFEGTGLGLALVKEFAILLGGDVSVNSAPGEGSTFIVEIQTPLADQSEDVVVKPFATRFQKYDVTKSDVISGESENLLAKPNETEQSKILIAEDNEELATYVASLLGEFAVTKHASDGEEAWKLVESWQPDLVILDVMMPKRDGISVCREIKSSATTKHIPVILLTALTHRDALLRGWEAGADEYLFKPFHPKELTTRIKLLLKYAKNNNLVTGLNRKLVVAARVTGMSEVANDILHNLGNILNSMNVRTNLIIESLEKSHIKELEKLTQSMNDMNSSSIMMDEKKQIDLILYLQELMKVLAEEQKNNLENALSVNEFCKDIISIIDQQKNTSDLYGVIESVDLAALLDEVINDCLENSTDIQVNTNYDSFPKATIDKMRLKEILMNLISNAKESLQDSNQANKEISISTKTFIDEDREWLEIEVKDNGVGISIENLDKIFTFGFSTKPAGRGLGLHISNLSAQKMGGSLRVISNGNDSGATFYLLLPLEPMDFKKWIKI